MRSIKLVLTTMLGLASALLPGSRAEAQVVMDFSYTGSNQTFVVPDNVTSLFVKLWGAGGAGGSGTGGGGGFTSGNLAVTPGETLILIVGGGGLHSVNGSSGNAFGGGGNAIAGGGGRTGIRLLGGMEDLADAGGGGGADLGKGGAGGGTSGMAGSSVFGSGDGGGGGTQSAGGVGFLAGNGSQYQGGTGSVGGGGGGYFGGGGGGFFPSGFNFFGAGGGSGFIGSLTGASTLAGSGATPANMGDADYLMGVGVGGDNSNSNNSIGGNGYAVFRYTVNGSSVPEPGSIALLAGLGITGSLFAIRRRRRSRK